MLNRPKGSEVFLGVTSFLRVRLLGCCGLVFASEHSSLVCELREADRLALWPWAEYGLLRDLLFVGVISSMWMCSVVSDTFSGDFFLLLTSGFGVPFLPIVVVLTLRRLSLLLRGSRGDDVSIPFTGILVVTVCSFTLDEMAVAASS